VDGGILTLLDEDGQKPLALVTNTPKAQDRAGCCFEVQAFWYLGFAVILIFAGKFGSGFGLIESPCRGANRRLAAAAQRVGVGRFFGHKWRN